MALMKKCPFCAEIIQNKAIKCKHCGERLDTEEFQRIAEEKKAKKRQMQERVRRVVLICLTTIVISMILIIALAFLTSGSSRRQPVSARIKCNVIENASETYDAPVKVMEVRRLMVEKDISKEDLRRILLYVYNQLREKRGYKWSRTGPTQIALYAYNSIENYKESGGNWVGMLDWDNEKPSPQITFSHVYE